MRTRTTGIGAHCSLAAFGPLVDCPVVRFRSHGADGLQDAIQRHHVLLVVTAHGHTFTRCSEAMHPLRRKQASPLAGIQDIGRSH